MAISREVHKFDFISGFKLRIQSDPVIPMITPFIEPVPVISGHAHHISNFQLYFFLVILRYVIHYCNLLVFILIPKIPNIVQRLKMVRGIRFEVLHDFIRHPADLRGEGTD